MQMQAHVVVHRRSEPGFSLLEALLSAAILMIVALGLIPLFSNSISNNTTGGETSQATTFTKSQLEQLQELPFNNSSLTIAAGSPDLVTGSYFTRDARTDPNATVALDDPAKTWQSTAPSSTTRQLTWTRTTRVSQYDLGALDDGVLADAEKLDSSQSAQSRFKLIEVQLDSAKNGRALGLGQHLTFRLLKSF
jgi:Tfp pilus assembly protein PilV